MRKIIGLTVLLMFIIGASLCYAEEVQISNNKYLISAKVIQELPIELIKFKTKVIHSNGDYDITTYVLKQNNREYGLKLIEHYDRDGKYLGNFDPVLYYQPWDEGYNKKMIDTVIKYINEKGE